LIAAPFLACNDAASTGEAATGSTETANNQPVKIFELPPLGFEFNALEPAIDALTMEIHHGKHHGGYVGKLNDALKDQSRFGGMEIEAILNSIGEDDTAIRNNGGGHYNHSLFWKIIRPGGASQPQGVLADAINASFGSFETFVSEFSELAKTRFGSGWAWLSVDSAGKLFVSSTPNQDSPLMTKLAERPGTPILGLDVWEHAYYLNYQNRRPDYIASFMGIIDWSEVGARFAAISR
jgi:Fe-Mn family superoxide dismutase